MSSNVTEIPVDEYKRVLGTLKKNFLEGMEVLNILENAWIVDNRETTENSK
jgi:hypothetical protein